MRPFDERWPRKPPPRRGVQGFQVYAGGLVGFPPHFSRPLDKPQEGAQEKWEPVFRGAPDKEDTAGAPESGYRFSDKAPDKTRHHASTRKQRQPQLQGNRLRLTRLSSG